MRGRDGFGALASMGPSVVPSKHRESCGGLPRSIPDLAPRKRGSPGCPEGIRRRAARGIRHLGSDVRRRCDLPLPRPEARDSRRSDKHRPETGG